MDKIYVFGIYTGTSSYGTIRDAEPCGDVSGYAIDRLIVDPQDGKIKLNVIENQWSSGENWCKHDMGITSDWKHDISAELYPDGYELEWLGCFNSGEEAYNTVCEMLSGM